MAKKAKKAATKRETKSKAKKRPAGKRDLVTSPNATSYAKRTAKGRFKEMDEVGRSQKADRRKKAKKKVKSGFGDRGDR